MEVKSNDNINSLLNGLNLTVIDNLIVDKNPLVIRLYFLLMIFSGCEFLPDTYIREQEIIDDFLRKINNLKIKIQLRRKEKEIEELFCDIKKIYIDNLDIIEKYNIDKLDIINILSSYVAKDITSLIDSLTKRKFYIYDKRDNLFSLRENILNNILNKDIKIKDNMIEISTSDLKIDISISDFYIIFDYLLDYKIYKKIFVKDESNNSRDNIIKNIINIINSKEIILDDIKDLLVPLNLLKEMCMIDKDYDMSNFKIKNIKITDLYSFVNSNIDSENKKMARWNKVYIPNDYLLDKLKLLIKKGEFYITKDEYIFENVIDKSNDFKVSINKSDMEKFILREIN